jgi:hypothetical protein
VEVQGIVGPRLGYYGPETWRGGVHGKLPQRDFQRKWQGARDRAVRVSLELGYHLMTNANRERGDDLHKVWFVVVEDGKEVVHALLPSLLQQNVRSSLRSASVQRCG